MATVWQDIARILNTSSSIICFSNIFDPEITPPKNSLASGYLCVAPPRQVRNGERESVEREGPLPRLVGVGWDGEEGREGGKVGKLMGTRRGTGQCVSFTNLLNLPSILKYSPQFVHLNLFPLAYIL